MTRQIPKTLKKKLEASLKSLTPREAGRLALIYMRESSKANKEESPYEYRPLLELEEAWETRVAAARKRGLTEGGRESALFNGFLFLENLILATNDWAEREFYRLAYQVVGSSLQIDRQLEKDRFSEIARRVTDNIDRDIPYPVSREDYARLLAKIDLFHFEIDTNVVNEVMTAWATAQGFDQVNTEEMLRSLMASDRAEEVKMIVDDLLNKEADPKLRRIYLELEASQAWAKKVFQGDTEALEDWVTHGRTRRDWAGPGLTAKVWEDRKKQVADQIEGLIAAEKIQAFTVADLNECFDSTPIVDGSIPAWAALRSIWRGWLLDHEVLIGRGLKIDPEAIRGIMHLYTIDGDLEGEDLVNVVAEFVADCRAKIWGPNLAAEVDLDRLARFLIAKETPLTEDEGEALQLGRVNFEVFADFDGRDGLLKEKPFRVATCKNLHTVAADLGLAAEIIDEAESVVSGKGSVLFVGAPKVAAFDQSYLITNFYYPTADPKARRAKLAQIMRMIHSLEFSARPFTSGRRNSSDFLGGEFTSQLEEWVKLLGRAFGEAATIRRVFEIIADEYFDGLPVLLPYNEENFANSEALLQYTEEDLADWRTRLRADPWNIDIPALQLVKDAVDEERARQLADMIIQINARMSGLASHLHIDLGDGLDPRRPAANPKPAKIEVEAGGE